MTTKDYIVLSFLIIFFQGCVSSEYTTETENKKEDEIYVFDDVSKIDTSLVQNDIDSLKEDKIKESKPTQLIKYTVQVGAFSSKERAELFISQQQNKTSFPLKIVFLEDKKLYSVQIPPYSTKEEADKIRDILKNFPSFKDAFTLTTEVK